MTSTDSMPAAPAAPADTVFDGFLRLLPYDGMFLRAGHLVTIEDYARALSSAGGRSGGAGVAYGYTVALAPAGQSLHVDAGLAVTADGTELQLDTGRDVPLPQAKVTGTAAWVVRAAPGQRPEGDPELVYGSICDGGDDPGPQRPLVAEGVSFVYAELRLDVAAGTVQELRSKLARDRFRQERSVHTSLLADLANAGWASGTSARPDDPMSLAGDVALAVLLRVDGQWYVDPWLVRRDLIESPPARDWQWRLGQRPRNVFLAQVLQFQSQVREILDLATAGGSLGDRGFVELPPAGFLPLTPPAAEGPGVRDYLATLLGNYVDPTFYACDASAVADRFWAAQHLGRIPLPPAGTKAAPTAVDVLVPGQWTGGGQGPASLVPSTSWAAFVRHARVELEPAAAAATDVLRVYAAVLDRTEYDKLPAPPDPGPTPDVKELVGDVEYPGGAFEPPDTQVFDAISSTLADAVEATVLVVARNAGELPVTALRAALLVAPFRDPAIHFRFWAAGGEPPRMHLMALRITPQ